MHKYLPPQPANMYALQDDACQIKCPVVNCPASFLTGVKLQLHINQEHVYQTHPSQQQMERMANANQPQSHPVPQNWNVPVSPTQSSSKQQARIAEIANKNQPQPVPQYESEDVSQTNPSQKEVEGMANANANRPQPQSLPPPQSVNGQVHQSHPPTQHQQVQIIPPAIINRGQQMGTPLANTRALPMPNQSSISPRPRVEQIQVTHNSQFIQCVWPPQAEMFLKALILQYSYFNHPTSQGDRHKLSAIFKDFRETIGLGFLNIFPKEERIPMVFETKVREIQASVMDNQLAQRKKDAENLGFSNVPQIRNISSLSQPVPSTISTPPLTPDISIISRQTDVLDSWNSSEADTQINIFHQLLRTAKDPHRLTLEWERWNTELWRKGEGQTKSSVGPKLVDRMRATPSSASPVDSEGGNLKSMIDTRLREARLKRQRDKETEIQLEANKRVEEDGEVKRIKIEAS